MLLLKVALTLAGMAVIPQGSYAPLYAVKGAERVRVSRFALDVDLVTRGEFLDFVRTNPEWRRSSVARANPGSRYLDEWISDLVPGNSIDLRRPVTSVSRSAALAYCESKGKRLPTEHEWEYAGAASATKRDASRDRSFIARLVGYYRMRSSAQVRAVGRGAKNYYGLRDMHDLTWEWTANPAAHEHHRAHEHHMYCASSAIGATDPSNYAAFMRYAMRSALTDRTTLRTLGFRCAADAPAA